MVSPQMTYDDIQQAFKVTRALYLSGDIPEPEYYKLIVGLAADFSGIGLVDDAMGLLTSVPNEYFSGQQKQDLEDDEDYKQKILTLAETLINEGRVFLSDTEDSLMYHVMLRSNKVGKA